MNTAFRQGLILNTIIQNICQLFGSKCKITFSIVLDYINLVKMVHSEEESTGRSRNMDWLVWDQSNQTHFWELQSRTVCHVCTYEGLCATNLWRKSLQLQWTSDL